MDHAQGERRKTANKKRCKSETGGKSKAKSIQNQIDEDSKIGYERQGKAMTGRWKDVGGNLERRRN